MVKSGRGIIRLCTVLAGITLTLAGFAQAPSDPEASLKAINTWYADQLKQARGPDNKTPLTQAGLTAMLAERKTRAQAALKDADPAKTDPAKCLALAQLYQITQQTREMQAAAQRFLTSNPDERQKYSAQTMILTGYQQAGDAEGLMQTLAEMKPPTPQLAAALASSTARLYAPLVADKKGLQAGLDLIKKMEALVAFDQFKTDVEKRIHDSTIASLAMGRSELYEKAGKKAESLAALEEGIKRLGPDNVYARSMAGKLKLANLPGSPAPELKMDHHYGDFKSLADLRGKVVVLDFTAHW